MKSLYSLTLPIFFLCAQIWSMEGYNIPPDCWFCIVKFLEISDLKNLHLVSKKIYKSVNHDALWHVLALRYFGNNAEALKGQDETWKSALSNHRLIFWYLSSQNYSEEELLYAISDEGFAKYQEHILKNLQIKLANSVKVIDSPKEFSAFLFSCFMTYIDSPYDFALNVARKAAFHAACKAADSAHHASSLATQSDAYHAARVAAWKDAEDRYPWKKRLKVASMAALKAIGKHKNPYKAGRKAIKLALLKVCNEAVDKVPSPERLVVREDVGRLLAPAVLNAANRHHWADDCMAGLSAAWESQWYAVDSSDLQLRNMGAWKNSFDNAWETSRGYISLYLPEARDFVESALNKLGFQDAEKIGSASWKLAGLCVLALISGEGQLNCFERTAYAVFNTLDPDSSKSSREILAIWEDNNPKNNPHMGMLISIGRAWLEKCDN